MSGRTAGIFGCLLLAMTEQERELFSELCEQRQYRRLADLLEAQNEIDIAEYIGELPLERAAVIFRLLKKDKSTDVFANLSSDIQDYIINNISNAEVQELIEDLYVDDAVDMLEEMPAGVVKRVLKNAEPETRQLINRFLNYPANSAGTVMTAEFVDLRRDMTARQAISYIRTNGVDKETVYTCYVTDEQRVLLGVISFRELLFSDPDALVGDLMSEDVISCRTTDDREDVAALISRYSFLALPVVDAEHRLVGIVTVDDAMDVIEQEATEDFHKLAAVAPGEKPYLDATPLSLAGHRIVWLMLLMVASIVTGVIINRYELAIAAVPLLVSFMPMITDTSGNAGSQSSTLVVRGLALGELDTRDWLRVCWKEIRVALLCGFTLAALNFLRIIIFYPGQTAVAATVSLSLIACVFLAKCVGSMLPLLAKLLKLDPAVTASPLIATICDSLALLTYFGIATALISF